MTRFFLANAKHAGCEREIFLDEVLLNQPYFIDLWQRK